MKTTSIVIPFYNQLQFLERSLRSAVAQTTKDIEIIVVNDGSEQDPSELVLSIGDDRVRVINQRNSGVANARNKAIPECAGEFIVFLDADDWLDATMVGKLVSLMRSSGEIGFAYCDVFRVDTSGNAFDEFRVATSRRELSGNILPSLLIGGYFPPASVMVRASALASVGGFDQALGGCCDWDLWIRLCAAGYQAKFHEERLAYYCIHDSSMSRDTSHMKKTAVETLAKNMAAYPAQIANAMHGLIETSERIYSTNAEILNAKGWLEGQLDSYRSAYETAASRIASLEQTCMDLTTGKKWLEEQWKAYRTSYDSAAKRIAELEQTCADLTTRNNSLEKQLRSH